MQTLLQTSKHSVQLTVDEAIGTGDVVLQTSTKQLFAVIERKTHADLLASLRDARYKTQTDRMKAMVAANECHVAGYIVEGAEKDWVRNVSLQNVRDSLVCQHRLMFWKTSTTEETADLLLRLAQKTEGYVQKLAQSSTPGLLGGAPTGSFAKKGDLRVRLFFEHQLMLVPRVSAVVAAAITKEYPTLPSLMCAWNDAHNETAKCNLLASIKIGDKRTVGPALSKSIYCLFTATV